MAVYLTPKFFKNERNNYSNWELAVWRELFQNAVDQDADRITIGLTQGNNCVNLSFSDNGPGMSRKVLTEVYFALGESTKDQDPTKIGGMGRARLLTCFSMQSYRIFSQDYEVASNKPMIDGVRPAAVGSDCEPFNHPWTEGCKLVLEVDDTTLERMERALNQFLYESRLSPKVFLNGQRVIGKSLNAGRHIRDLQANAEGKHFAQVWVNKSVKTKRVIIRVNGVSMFTTSTNAEAQIVVELEPSISRDVLTASRDGLHYRYQDALNQFLNELAVDTTSALRTRSGRRTSIVRAGGMRTIHRAPDRKTPVKSSVQQPVQQPAPVAGFYEAPPVSTELANVNDTVEVTQQPEDFDGWLGRTFGDIYLYDETENLAMRKVITQYHPNFWNETEVYSGGWKKYRKGGNIIRVLLMWHTAISYAIEVGLPALEKSDVAYAVGFVFNPEHRADHREQDGGHVFSLNPVDASGKLRYAITQRSSLKRIMTLAKHEVTHVNISWHGESFSHLREKIDEVFDDGECLRRMKDALKNANI